MVSDWQGGDISKLFPALSGKEDLSMGEDKKADKKRKRIVPKAPVQMIISREYVGTQTVTEAFVPIISEDIRKKIAEGDTFDAVYSSALKVRTAIISFACSRSRMSWSTPK